MKTLLRIFNVIIMALSAAATVLLFVTPTVSFNSLFAIDVVRLAEYVPETIYTDQIDIVSALGTDRINVQVKFKLGIGETAGLSKGDKTSIDNAVLIENMDRIINEMHEPLDLIADYSIRSIIKSTIKAEIIKQVEEARTAAGSASTAEEILDECGVNDAYMDDFARNLYNAANEDNATIDSVSEVLSNQIEDALGKASETGMVDTSVYTQEKKDQVKTSLTQVLTDLKLTYEVDGVIHVKKIGHICYIYLADHLVTQLTGKVEPSILEKGPEESDVAFSDRLLKTYVLYIMPAMFYKIVGYICTAMIICVWVFAAVWLFLITWTFIKTLSKKPWTFFGPWFWAVGAAQVGVGLILTWIGKYCIPNFKLLFKALPLKTVILAPRTSALIPSLFFIVMIGIGIAYYIIKKIAKKTVK